MRGRRINQCLELLGAIRAQWSRGISSERDCSYGLQGPGRASQSIDVRCRCWRIYHRRMIRARVDEVTECAHPVLSVTRLDDEG